MSEALRDAYARACVEYDAACKALEAAKLRAQTARETCVRLETELQMTRLSDGLFPQLDCAAAKPHAEAVPPKRSG